MSNEKQFPIQFGQSITCDFNENTWTFEMPKGFCWTGGKFAIVPDNDYQSLQSERDEYRQRLEENVKSIESMLHHNEVLTKERDALHARIAELEDELQTHVGLVDHMKEVCDEYEKELQMKQKAIDALLDPKF